MKLLALLLACTLGCSAAITLDTTVKPAKQIGTGNTGFSWSHTIGSGQNRALYVMCAGLNNAAGTLSVTVAGVALPKIQASGIAGLPADIWEMVNPPGQAQTIVATWSLATNTANDELYCASISLFGVNQQYPSSTVNPSVDATTTNHTNSATVTTTAADWIIGAAEGGNATVMSPLNGQTEIWNDKDPFGYPRIAMAYMGPTSIGSVTMSWSNNDVPNCISIVAIHPWVSNGTRAISSGASSEVPPSGLAITPLSTYAAGVGGDTEYFTWTSPATRSGNWGGGALVGTWNDYSGTAFGCSNRSICVFEITAYDKTIPSATFGAINDMSSYGAFSATGCYDGVKTMKSRKPFAFNGVIFLPIFCMDNGAPFHAYQSGFVVSPDGGAHWCNLKTFNAHATSPNCDSANWVANGDNPVDAAGFQWPLATGASKMTRMEIVDFLCQDNTTNCPVAAGVDPAYLYFEVTDNTAAIYMARVPRSLGWKGIMAGDSNWQVYNAGSWTSTVQNASDVSNGIAMSSCCNSIFYLKDFATFVLLDHVNQHYFTAQAPWGTWVQQSNLILYLTANFEFPSLMPGLCPKYDVAGRVTCTGASDGPTSSNLRLIEFDIGPAKPVMATSGQR